MKFDAPTDPVTFLFTDIEGSTRLWEMAPEAMRAALARHDALTRSAIEGNAGIVVKMTGDGVYAAFADAGDALGATLQLQQGLIDDKSTTGVSLKVRCGLHAGVVEHRDNDFFGSAVNRAARIMGAAHGGQILLSQAVAERVATRLPGDASLRDLGNVRLKDLARPEHVFQLVHPQLRAEFPALRSLETTPNNLPQQLNAFIGREREVDRVRTLLAAHRLVTVLGAGGMGKTRLSLHVAADMLDEFADGIWLVEFAPLSDAQLVPHAVASALGVREEPGRAVIEALEAHVRDRSLMLVLDNCEHLTTACAGLARQLLRAGSQVKVLATSREPLRVTGETTYSLSPLGVPDPDEQPTPAALARCEAVRLFVARATAVQPDFRLQDSNGAAAAHICRRLDGIPLALELAAARTRALSVEAIAARLSDRLGSAVAGDRNAPSRQETMRACIDWSYDLLAQPERGLLRRLAVFAGGFVLEAAESVGTGSGLDRKDVADVLARLVEKSLVAFDAEAARYRLLETVRQYAQERLAAAEEESEARTQHLAFYLSFVEEAADKLRGGERTAWMARLDLERENILSAHAWCDHAPDGSRIGLRLVCAIQLYWFTRGLMGLGLRENGKALDRVPAVESALLRCRVLLGTGYFAHAMGRYADAQRFAEESLAIAHAREDPLRVFDSVHMMARIAQGRMDLAGARRHFEHALALARDLPDKLRLPAALNDLAEVYRIEGDLEAAERQYAEALALIRSDRDRDSMFGMATSLILLNLARVAIGRGAGDRAHDFLLEALKFVDDLSLEPAGQQVLEVAARLAALRGDANRAARFYGAAEADLELRGLLRESVDEASFVPLIAEVRRTLGEAGFNAAETDGRMLRYADAIVEVRGWLRD